MRIPNRFLISVTAGLLALAVIDVTPASAGKLRERRQTQLDRIEAGLSNRSLTTREAHRLRFQQKKLRRTAQRMRSDDGKLSQRERKKLNRMQNRASRQIIRAKHNRRTAS